MFINASNLIKKTRPLRQARTPHPQRRLKMGIIIQGRNSGAHIAAIIQQFLKAAML
jgi:hypothetical protein